MGELPLGSPEGFAADRLEIIVVLGERCIENAHTPMFGTAHELCLPTELKTSQFHSGLKTIKIASLSMFERLTF